MKSLFPDLCTDDVAAARSPDGPGARILRALEGEEALDTDAIAPGRYMKSGIEEIARLCRVVGDNRRGLVQFTHGAFASPEHVARIGSLGSICSAASTSRATNGVVFHTSTMITAHME